MVEGAAGTGKTVLAVRWAQEEARAGHRVLFLCYNIPLGELLKRETAEFLARNGLESDRLHTMTFHQFCFWWLGVVKKETGNDWLEETKLAFPGQSLNDVQLPNALAFAVEDKIPPYDTVVVDEAQDFGDEYWGALELLLSKARAVTFMDPNQAIFRRSTCLPGWAIGSFSRNCRNTQAIHTACLRYYKGPDVEPPPIPGEKIREIHAQSPEHQAQALIGQLRELNSKQGIELHDIAVLVLNSLTKKAAWKLLEAQQANGVRFSFEEHFQPSASVCDTVARYKGLESLVVILWLNGQLDPQEARELLYVALSRARSLIIIVGNEADCARVMGGHS